MRQLQNGTSVAPADNNGLQASMAEKESYMMARSLKTKRVPVLQLYNDRLAHAYDLGRQHRNKTRDIDGSSITKLLDLFYHLNEDTEDYLDLFVDQAVQCGSLGYGRKRCVSTWSHFLKVSRFVRSRALTSMVAVPAPSRLSN